MEGLSIITETNVEPHFLAPPDTWLLHRTLRLLPGALWKLRASAEVFFVHLQAFSSLAFSFVFFLLLDRLHARLLHLAICFTSGERMQPVMPRLLLYVCTKKVDRKAGGIRRRPGHRRAQAGRWSSPVNTPQIQRNTSVQYSSRKSVTFRTSLTGLSALFA